VSFDLAEGDVRVLGLNGAGKPTTLRTRIGLLRPR
jgi:ABC-type Na+ transport system ATPase subunit NatA